MEGQHEEPPASHEEYARSKASKFRLKPEHKRKAKRDSPDDYGAKEQSRKRHRSHRYNGSHSDKRRGRRERKHEDLQENLAKPPIRGFTQAAWNDEYANPDHQYRESLYDAHHGRSDIDPEVAFRESLFDALADDEGAEYWEGVYGQPIHIYPNMKPGPDGELERMTDEDYAQYVRRKMWEKSHEHILEEREARAKQRDSQKKQRRGLEEDISQQEAEREAARRRMQESIRLGEERKRAKEVDAAWVKYLKKWEELKSNKHLDRETSAAVQEFIPWPVVSGRMRHVSKDQIDRFFEHSSAWRDDATALLKVERVRWHPDKMQQRFGQHLNDETMKAVTAVFQVIDRLWSERRT
ncbi:hypothetical protein BDV96DRAFT_617605 [Lophiotrema nucula]|uniref:Uncharacterized protein n=1 Tax=Lophiotrema nucula TaxID=690887 RepID=A0A6A5YFN4_9PLEO|nr:hypothetical protein BDV96DRAFT_617605 [Lophiotrema nucula]